MVLLGIAVPLMMGDPGLQRRNQRLVMAALLSAIAGRIMEQMVGIPDLADKILFWAMLGVLAGLPDKSECQNEKAAAASYTGDTAAKPIALKQRVTLNASLALVLAVIVVAFTLVKNPPYALAEVRANAAEESLLKRKVERGHAAS